MVLLSKALLPQVHPFTLTYWCWQTIKSNLLFSVLPKDISTCGHLELGINPSTLLRYVGNLLFPLSHSHII